MLREQKNKSLGIHRENIMKCEAMIRKESYGKKGRTRISHIFSMWHIIVKGFKLDFPLEISGPGACNYKKSEFRRCKGNVKATVSIETDDGCGCCGYTHIQIDYICDTCKNRCFYELPQDEKELSILLTEHIAGLSKAKRDLLLDKKLKIEQANDKLREEIAKKLG